QNVRRRRLDHGDLRLQRASPARANAIGRRFLTYHDKATIAAQQRGVFDHLDVSERPGPRGLWAAPLSNGASSHGRPNGTTLMSNVDRTDPCLITATIVAAGG